MKIISAILIAFSVCLTSLLGAPTKEELLERLYLVTVGKKEYYGKFLEEGVLTDRHQPFIVNHAPYYGSQYDECPNGLEVCDKSNFANVCLQSQRGLFYFTPGYIFGPPTAPWKDYGVAILMPLKNVYDKLVNLSWGEFVTYDNIPLTNDTIVLVEKSPEATHYAQHSAATILPFEKIEDRDDRVRFKVQLIKDVIKDKGGYLVEYNSDVEGDGDVDLKVDGEKIRFKAKKDFYASLLNEYITYGYKNLSNARYVWVDEMHSNSNFWYDRNYGFEFYAFMKGALAFIKERGIHIEDTGTFQEAVIAHLLAWDLLSVENPILTMPSLISKHEAVPSEVLEVLEQAMQRQVAFYKDKPLQTLYEDLIHKEAYKYKNMPSNPKIFKRSFIEQVCLMNRAKAKEFISEYKDFLLKTGSEAPYPLENLEQKLIELYDQFQTLAGPLITVAKDDDLMMSLTLLAEGVTGSVDSAVNDNVYSEIAELLERFLRGESNECPLSYPSICEGAGWQYNSQGKLEALSANDSERQVFVEEVRNSMQNKLKDFCERKEDIVYRVYASDHLLKDGTPHGISADGDEYFDVEIQPCKNSSVCDWLKNKTIIKQGASLIANTIKDGVLIIRNASKVVASFELAKSGKQTAYCYGSRYGRLYEITFKSRELPEDKAYLVDINIELLCADGGEELETMAEKRAECFSGGGYHWECVGMAAKY